jgi:hypothetical protein
MRVVAWIVGVLVFLVFWPTPWWWKHDKWQNFFLLTWLVRWAKEEISSKPNKEVI